MAGAVELKATQCAMAAAHAELIAVGMMNLLRASPALILCCAASCHPEIYWVLDGKCHRYTCHTMCPQGSFGSVLDVLLSICQQ